MKVQTMMANNFTKTTNHFSPQLIEYKSTTTYHDGNAVHNL